ncbi:MAG: hypothetical protein R3208_00450, partial [Ketobacteraceae bacterium]|nr:hypothetical protein [Ketobacteraceae bacterium]
PEKGFYGATKRLITNPFPVLQYAEAILRHGVVLSGGDWLVLRRWFFEPHKGETTWITTERPLLR